MGQLLSGLMIGGRVVPEMLLSSKKIKLLTVCYPNIVFAGTLFRSPTRKRVPGCAFYPLLSRSSLHFWSLGLVFGVGPRQMIDSMSQLQEKASDFRLRMAILGLKLQF
jgi:hypothetical protein